MKHRLFIAIEIPETFYPSVKELQSRISSLKVPVEWEDLDRLHLTLNFIGRVDDSELPAVRGQMRSVIARFPKFILRPMFLESLYSRHDGSIIYLAPGGDVNILKELQESLGEKLNEMNLPRQSRFLPHIKIGIYKKADPTTTKQFMDKVSDIEIYDWPEFTVQKIWLIESQHTKVGSHYQKIAQFMLRSQGI